MKVYIMIPSVVLVMFEAVEVILPTVTGLMGILENHTTMPVETSTLSVLLAIEYRSVFSDYRQLHL